MKGAIKMKRNNKVPYIRCSICNTAFMSMITISMKHIGADNKSPTIALCKTCLQQIKEHTNDIDIREGTNQ